MLAMKFEEEGKKLIDSFDAEFEKHESLDQDPEVHVNDPLEYARVFNYRFRPAYAVDGSIKNEPSDDAVDAKTRRSAKKAEVREQRRLTEFLVYARPLHKYFNSCLVMKARHPEVRIWCRNAGMQDFECFLHQTYMDDLRLRVLFGQSPTPAQFDYWISKIWEHEVAVIVSIGNKGQKSMIDPYVSLKEGDSTLYSRVEVLENRKLLVHVTDRIPIYGGVFLTTRFVAENPGAGYIHYGIDISQGSLSPARQIDVLHIYEWPENPASEKLTALAEIIREVDRLRAGKRTKAWSESRTKYSFSSNRYFSMTEWLSRDLPIVVHCDDGQYRSPAFGAMLVAHHRMIRQGKVSVMEILRRVRRLRYHAWHGDARKAFGQFQLVFAVAAMLMEKTAKAKAKLKPRVSTADIVKRALVNQGQQIREGKDLV